LANVFPGSIEIEAGVSVVGFDLAHRQS
jgi:hypothetical protein